MHISQGSETRPMEHMYVLMKRYDCWASSKASLQAAQHLFVVQACNFCQGGMREKVQGCTCGVVQLNGAKIGGETGLPHG